MPEDAGADEGALMAAKTTRVKTSELADLTRLVDELAGLLKPLSGRIEVDGAEVSELDLKVRAQKIALVAQESELLFPLRVWEYVLQGRYPYGRRLRFESDEDCLLAGNALAQVGAQPGSRQRRLTLVPASFARVAHQPTFGIR